MRRKFASFLIAGVLSVALVMPAWGVETASKKTETKKEEPAPEKPKAQIPRNNNPDAAPTLNAIRADSRQPVPPSKMEGAKKEEETKKTQSAKTSKKESASKKQAKNATKTKEAAMGPQKPRIENVDLDKLESIGLYNNEAEGSLGSDIWRNAARSEVAPLIRDLDGDAESATLQDLHQRLMLTAANARALKDDIEPAPGEDLFTLRLEKLLDLGAYKEAREMYELDKNDPYDARLAQTGILATLYTGQKSLACLDMKATTENLAKDSFLKDFGAYCSVSLADMPDEESVDILKKSNRHILYALATNKNYGFVYDPKAFESLSKLEQALIVAEGKLDLRNLERINRGAIPPRHIPLLLVQKNLPPKQKFLLTLQAVKVGLMPAEEVFNMYEDMLKPGLGEDPKADPPKPNTDWEMLAWLYNAAGNQPPGPEQWAVVKQAFGLADIYGDAALIPYASYISGLKPEGLTLRDARHAFNATRAAGSALPPYWSKALEGMEPEVKNDKDKYYQLLTANYIAQPAARRAPEQKERILAYLKEHKGKFACLAHVIIENVDKDAKDNNNASEIYDKDYCLTSSDDYVMPSGDVWDRLNQESQKKTLGETVLLSASALHGKTWQDLNPALVRQGLDAYDNVGLNDVSRNLAIEAVLGSK